MWVSYHSLNSAIPRQLIQSDPELRRPMVPRLRQPTVPKTVITLYQDGQTPTITSTSSQHSFCSRLLKRCFKPASVPADSKHRSPWRKFTDLLRNDSTCLLLLMFADVLVNTAMLVLNHTSMVMDFFDNIDWSTVLTRMESVSFSGEEDEQEFYVQYMNNRKAIMAKLNMLIYILIYIAQLMGFFGAIRLKSAFLTAYVTQLSIQIIVLVFTVILRPFWLPVCLLRILLFWLGLKLSLQLSNHNVQMVWDFECTEVVHPSQENANVQAFRPLSSHEERAESEPSGLNANRLQVVPLERHRSQTLPTLPSASQVSSRSSGHPILASGKRRDRQNVCIRPLGDSENTNTQGSHDETSVIEVMASIKHVQHIPLPASTFDVNSMSSIESAEL